MMPSVTRIGEVLSQQPAEDVSHEGGDEFSVGVGPSSGGPSSTNPPPRMSRPAMYDYHPQLTANRLPSGDYKSFGMLRGFANEPRDAYIAPEQWGDYTPRFGFDDELNPRLMNGDGTPLHVTKVEYVVMNDPGHRSGERLLVNSSDGELKHSDLAAGLPIKYGGELSTDSDGQLTHLDLDTGHYLLPDPASFRQLIAMDSSLSDAEKAHQLQILDERGRAFQRLLMDKFSNLIPGVEEVERPETPPLDLDMLDLDM
jgi:hypothetical protein